MNRNHPFRRLAALVALATAVVGVSAGCSHDAEAKSSSASVASGPQPKTLDAAKLAAQTMFDRFSGGDFAGAWEMYTATAKKAISQADYVKLNQACARKGLAITLTSARLDGPTTAIVIAKQLVAAQAYTMVYEGNAWRLQPAPAGLKLYSLGADKAIAAQRKAGTCANA
jgi:hypothetical protein